MEEKAGMDFGFAVKVGGASESDGIGSRPEDTSAVGGSVEMAAHTPMESVSVVKKKRGRPRKYGPDGALAPTLSPMPISSSIPLSGEFAARKRGRGRSLQSIKKSRGFDGILGNGMPSLVGADFMPHVITVNAGEDVNLKIMSLSQQGSRAICILSANGMISNVTLRQSTSSGGTLTYEGRFEILSLSGSYMPSENGSTKSRSGGMSVSLAGPDGRVMGGGLAGMLVAACPVQVVIGSFLPSFQDENKPKNSGIEPKPAAISSPAYVPSSETMKGAFGGEKPVVSSGFIGHDAASSNPIPVFRTPSVEFEAKSSFPDEPKGGFDHGLSINFHC